MTDNKTPCQATPAATLREQIMDSRIPKNEREWWAARTIEKLERELAEARKMLYRLARPFFPSEGATIQDENTRLRAEIELLKDKARLDGRLSALKSATRNAAIEMDGNRWLKAGVAWEQVESVINRAIDTAMEGDK